MGLCLSVAKWQGDVERGRGRGRGRKKFQFGSSSNATTRKPIAGAGRGGGRPDGRGNMPIVAAGRVLGRRPEGRDQPGGGGSKSSELFKGPPRLIISCTGRRRPAVTLSPEECVPEAVSGYLSMASEFSKISCMDSVDDHVIHLQTVSLANILRSAKAAPDARDLRKPDSGKKVTLSTFFAAATPVHRMSSSKHGRTRQQHDDVDGNRRGEVCSKFQSPSGHRPDRSNSARRPKEPKSKASLNTGSSKSSKERISKVVSRSRSGEEFKPSQDSSSGRHRRTSLPSPLDDAPIQHPVDDPHNIINLETSHDHHARAKPVQSRAYSLDIKNLDSDNMQQVSPCSSCRTTGGFNDSHDFPEVVKSYKFSAARAAARDRDAFKFLSESDLSTSSVSSQTIPGYATKDSNSEAPRRRVSDEDKELVASLQTSGEFSNSLIKNWTGSGRTKSSWSTKDREPATCLTGTEVRVKSSSFWTKSKNSKTQETTAQSPIRGSKAEKKVQPSTDLVVFVNNTEELPLPSTQKSQKKKSQTRDNNKSPKKVSFQVPAGHQDSSEGSINTESVSSASASTRVPKIAGAPVTVKAPPRGRGSALSSLPVQQLPLVPDQSPRRRSPRGVSVRTRSSSFGSSSSLHLEELNVESDKPAIFVAAPSTPPRPVSTIISSSSMRGTPSTLRDRVVQSKPNWSPSSRSSASGEFSPSMIKSINSQHHRSLTSSSANSPRGGAPRSNSTGASSSSARDIPLRFDNSSSKPPGPPPQGRNQRAAGMRPAAVSKLISPDMNLNNHNNNNNSTHSVENLNRDSKVVEYCDQPGPLQLSCASNTAEFNKPSFERSEFLGPLQQVFS